MVTTLQEKRRSYKTEQGKDAYTRFQKNFGLYPRDDKKTIFSHTLGILKQRKYAKLSLVSITGFALIYSFLYGLWQMPFLQLGFTRMAEISFVDVIYIILISVMAGLLVPLVKYKIDDRTGPKMGGLGGVFAGFVSTVCPVCQGITFAALGSTIAVPLGFLIPYLWILQIATVFILGLSLYLAANSIYAKTCISCDFTKRTEHREKHTIKGPFLYRNNIAFAALMVLVLMLVINNFMITSAFAAGGASSNLNSGSISLKPGFEYGAKLTLKPMPLASGESPRFQGYKTIVKPLPTISEISISASSGDVAQDIVSNVVPRGTPWYGQEAGVSFDDPITAQKLWAKGRAIQLDAEEQKRWERTVNSFTCDYCCGSPQQPTIITRCGCAHAAAAQGMAKWFIKNYGNKYSDEEIYGEMARWYALWYPGPTVQRILQELQAAN